MQESKRKRIALILVEGDTEEEFYNRIANEKLAGYRKVIRNLKGNFNIYNKVLDRTAQYSEEHDDHNIDVFVCIDQEKPGRAVFDSDLLKKKLSEIKHFRSLTPVIAVLMLESLFFIDIENIYRFLRTPNAVRNPAKYANFRNRRHQDLSKLFEQVDKIYQKGIRCANFVDHLDLDKIIAGADELQVLITKIREQQS